MNSKGRYMVALCMGFAAAALAWSVLELVLSFQNSFPNYTALIMFSGAAVGAALGAVIASIEGILHKNTLKIHKEWSLGLLWGAAGGVLGAMAGQWMFNRILPDSPDDYLLPYYIARVISWMIIGAFTATAEGLRSRSMHKILAGVFSGIAGGLAGGAIVETAMLFFPEDSWLKLPGFMIMAVGTSVLTILIEEKSSPGVLRVLNGGSKGRKYLLNQRRITLGSRGNCDIVIQGNENIPPLALELKRKNKELYLTSTDDKCPVFVNEESVRSCVMKYEDVIKIGDLKFLYEVKK